MFSRMFANDPVYVQARTMNPVKFKQFITSYIVQTECTFDDLIKHCTFKQLEAAEIELARLDGLHDLDGADLYHHRYLIVKAAALHLKETQCKHMMHDLMAMSVVDFSSKYDAVDMAVMKEMLKGIRC